MGPGGSGAEHSDSGGTENGGSTAGPYPSQLRRHTKEGKLKEEKWKGKRGKREKGKGKRGSQSGRSSGELKWP